MSEYIITIKQLATVIAKCHGLMPENEDGTPICNSREIAELIDEPITLKEIVRCRDCEFPDETESGELRCHGYLVEAWDWYNDMPSDGVKVKPDGFCAWGERRTDDN